MGEGENSFIALPSQGGTQQANDLKTVPPSGGLVGGFIVWGVKNRASDKDQVRGNLPLFSKLAFSDLKVISPE